ncbi:MAG: hypothetical protein ACKPCM_11365 [Pseudanabaena sp.]
MNCRFCKNYAPQGRNGGHCSALSVPVQGKWESCRLYLASFTAKSSPIAVGSNIPPSLVLV